MLSGRKVKFGGILCLLAAPLALSPPAAGQCSYSVQIVYGPPGPDGEPSGMHTEGMNEMGDFTGWWRYALDVDFAFRYTQAGGVETLNFPPGLDWNPHAMDIDNNKVIAGWVINTLGYQQPFIWDQGEVTELSSPDNAHVVAYGLNEAGLVVGGAPDPLTGEWRPAFWQDGELTVLTVLNDFGFAEDVNANGTIVGYFGHTPPVHFTRRAFIWDGGIVTFLPPIPGGVTSTAFAISERGYITGGGSVWDPISGEYRSRAAAWINGVAYNLGTLPNTRRSIALDVNDFAQVVGRCTGPSVPFFWQHGVMHDLHDLIEPMPPGKVEIFNSETIDNSGVIVASGEIDDGAVTFILTPRHVDGDLNFDCTVNVLDLIELLGQWGEGEDMPADFNEDGTVNVLDLLYLLTHWG